MRIRIISASVGIPVVLIAIWSGLPGIAILSIVAGFISGKEIHQMMWPESVSKLPWNGVRVISLVMGPSIMACFGILLLTEGRIVGDHLPVTLAVVFALALLLRGTATLGKSGSNRGTGHQPFWVFSAYVGIALAHGPVLVAHVDGRQLLLMAILTTFAIDSTALCVGLLIGQTPLASNISPKKSLEGAVGGIVIGIIVTILINFVFATHFSMIVAAILGGLLGVIAVAGDLYESWIKRRAAVKDSGTLIPGHGGILDRLDSVIPNIVVVYWAAVWSTP